MANYQFLNNDLIIINLSESVFTSDKFNDVDQLDIYRLLYYKHTNTNKTTYNTPYRKKNIEYYLISKENETKKTYTHKSNIYKTKTNTMEKKFKSYVMKC